MTDVSPNQSPSLTPIQGVRAAVGSMSRMLPTVKIGAGGLTAGIIASGDPHWASNLLQANGYSQAKAFCNTVRRLVQVDDPPDKVRITTNLATDVQQHIRDLKDGLADAPGRALKALTATNNEEVGWLFADPVDFFHHYQGAGSRPQSKADMMRGIAQFYGPKLGTIHRFFNQIDRTDGLIDFARPNLSELEAEVTRIEKASRITGEDVFGRPNYERSPFGRLRRDHGDVAAQLLEIAVTTEIGLIGPGPVTVWDVACILWPLRPLRMLSVLRDTVQTLKRKWIWAPDSRRSFIELRMPVMAKPWAMNEVLSFLGDVPIDQEDINNTLDQLA